MATPTDEANETRLFDRVSDIAEEPQCWLLPIEGYEKLPLVSLEKAIEPLISIVPDVKRKAYIAKQNCKQPADGHSPDESASIGLYTMEWEPYEKCLYVVLNRCLRDKQRETLKPWFLFLRLFLNAINKLPSSTCSVFRGIKMNLRNRYQQKSQFVWWGFSSCTTNISILQSEKFLGKKGERTLFTIECYSGKNIRQHSYYQYENEILLPPARNFEVIGSLDEGHGLYLVQLKEIESPFVLMEPVPVDDNHALPSLDIQENQLVSIKKLNSKLDSKINKYQQFEHVNLTYDNLTDDDMPIIVTEIIMFNICTEIDLSNNQITSKGISILASVLRKNTRLKTVTLLNNRISDEGIQSLAESLSVHNLTLTTLGLGSNDITDEGAKYLANMLQANRALLTLTLQQNHIGNRGVQLLMDALIRFNKKLQILNISSNTSINDSCLASVISMLTGNQTLKEFYMIKCSLSSTSSKKIQLLAKAKKDFDLYV